MSAPVKCRYCGVEDNDPDNVTMVDISDCYDGGPVLSANVKVCSRCGGTPDGPAKKYPATKSRVVYEPFVQWTAHSGFGIDGKLELIPPLAEEFIIYGGDAVVERARAWALRNRYLLAAGVDACAHGLLGLRCPAECHGRFRQLDHANLWVPADPAREEPFVMSQPYADEITDETQTYAEAHGLVADSETWRGDDWYHPSALSIRLTPRRRNLLWPIEERAIVLLSVCPVEWPEESS